MADNHIQINHDFAAKFHAAVEELRKRIDKPVKVRDQELRACIETLQHFGFGIVRVPHFLEVLQIFGRDQFALFFPDDNAPSHYLNNDQVKELVSSGALADWINDTSNLWGEYHEIVRQIEDYYQARLATITSEESLKTISSAVYMIKFEKYYKIGKSRNYTKRIQQINLNLPSSTELVHVIKTNRVDEIERYWHQKFHGSRLNGEWFTLTDEEIAEFKQHIEM